LFNSLQCGTVSKAFKCFVFYVDTTPAIIIYSMANWNMASSRDSFLADLKEVNYTVHGALCEIEAIKKKRKMHQRNVNISKAAGAVGSILGIALLFTPAFVVGAALTAAGAATHIVADVGGNRIRR